METISPCDTWRAGDLLLHQVRPDLPYPLALARFEQARPTTWREDFPSGWDVTVEWLPESGTFGKWSGEPADFINLSAAIRAVFPDRHQGDIDNVERK